MKHISGSMPRCALLVLIGLLPACASVKVAMPGLGSEPAATVQEKSALVEAVARLGAVVPPPAEREGLTLVVLGGRGDAETRAARAYLDALAARPASRPASRSATRTLLPAVMADVDALLTQARAVAEAGRPGAAATEREVALLEGAITDVQHARRVYVAALRLLREDGVPLTRAEIREVNDALVQSCRDIGAAADMVSARLRVPVPTRMAGGEGGGAETGY